MKFKKVLIPLSAILLASCGGGSSSSNTGGSSKTVSSEPSSEPTPTSSATSEYSGPTKAPFITEPTSIEFMSNSSYGENLDSYIEAFKKVEPNITVTNTKESASYQGVIDKVVEGIPANNYPDLVVGYPDAVEQIMELGKIVKLDNYIDHKYYGWSAEDKEDIIETYMEEGRSYPRSGTWSLPFAKSTEAMFYNKDVLIGLDLSKQDATINNGKPLDEAYIESLTWEELFDHLAPAIIALNDTLDADHKILKDNETYSKAVLGYDSDDNLFITLAEQYGYGYTSINEYGEGKLDFVNPEMKGLLKKFNTAKNKGYVITKGTSKGGNYTNYSFTNECALFTVGSTGGLKYQTSPNFETGVAPIPQAKGLERKVINQGPSLAILDHSDSNRVLASWLFAKFITNEVNSLDWSVNTGYLPIRYSVVESSTYQEIIKDGLSKDVHDLDHLKAVTSQYVGNSTYVGDALFASPVFKGSAQARTQVGGLVTELLALSEAEFDKQVDAKFQTAYDNTIKYMGA